MGNRIAGDSVDASSSVYLFDTVSAAQFLRSHLAGRGLFVVADGGEGEDAAGSDSQNSADDALFSHANSDQRMQSAVFLEELHHGDIVGQRGSGADNLVEVGGYGDHFFQRLIELPGSAEIVIGEDECGLGTQTPQLFGFTVGRSL